MGRQDEIDREAVERDRADRMAEMTPGVGFSAGDSRVARTPREEVEVAVLNAGECLRGGNLELALRWLDRALRVVRDPAVVDGAVALAYRVQVALDVLRSDWSLAEDELRSALAILESGARLAEPVIDDADFMAPSAVTDAKRQAVRAALTRNEMCVRGLAPAMLDVGVLDELIAAADTGI